MLFFSNVEELILVYRRCRPLSLEFEHHNTIIVARCEEIDFWMRCNNPESVVFALEGLYGSTLVQIPDANCFVLSDREYEVLMRVEKAGRGVLKVTPTSVDLPSLGFCNQSVIVLNEDELYKTHHSSSRA